MWINRCVWRMTDRNGQWIQFCGPYHFLLVATRYQKIIKWWWEQENLACISYVFPLLNTKYIRAAWNLLGCLTAVTRAEISNTPSSIQITTRLWIPHRILFESMKPWLLFDCDLCKFVHFVYSPYGFILFRPNSFLWFSLSIARFTTSNLLDTKTNVLFTQKK